MKYSNLTNKNIIMSWNKSFPTHINLLDENNSHILDWIFNGYRGKISSKIELASVLVTNGANLNLVKNDTYRQFLHQIFDNSKDEHTVVFENILKNTLPLSNFKNNLCEFNSLLLKKTISDRPIEVIKDKILFSDLVDYTPQKESDIQHKIGYNTHPIIFLFQYFLLFNSTLKILSTSLIKIKKIQEYNPQLILKSIVFEYKENCSSMHESLNRFKIKNGNNMTECFNLVLENFRLDSDKEPNLNIIEDITNINQYRELQSSLPTNNKKSIGLKI